jgi:hypothetical protein
LACNGPPPLDEDIPHDQLPGFQCEF